MGSVLTSSGLLFPNLATPLGAPKRALYPSDSTYIYIKFRPCGIIKWDPILPFLLRVLELRLQVYLFHRRCAVIKGSGEGLLECHSAYSERIYEDDIYSALVFSGLLSDSQASTITYRWRFFSSIYPIWYIWRITETVGVGSCNGRNRCCWKWWSQSQALNTLVGIESYQAHHGLWPFLRYAVMRRLPMAMRLLSID